ncbi:MAG: 30S ribosomal protein S1 [Candidatus Marinimicrobia bacterium]|nr:30S ribosomal protein S1 [Candidatus Neomarinimicrobiota bacterium]
MIFMINDENIIVNDNDENNSEDVDVSVEKDSSIENIINNEELIAENSQDTEVNIKPLLDYLSPDILTVKEYSFDEINNLDLDNKDFDEEDDIYDIKVQDVSERQLVKGTIVAVYDKEVIVDIGFKSEGIIDKTEFETIPEIGEEIDVFLVVFEDRKGRLILSKRRADFEKRWSELRDAAENDTILKGTVIKIIKGGLVVDLGVVNAFLPGSQVDIKPVSNFEEFLNKEFDFKIVKFNEFRQNVVVSRKATMDSDIDENRAKLLENIDIGSSIEGTIKNITDFGAFIDLGGVDGLLHITDITWGRINHPSDKLALGQSITVKIIDFDQEKKRISLGLKQLSADPWEGADDKYTEGTKISGKVVNMMNYGAFVEIEEGIEGLIHISEISWTKHIRHPSDIYKIGDNVDAVVLSIDIETKKISLGVKQLEDNPWSDIEKKIKVDETYKGNVNNIVQNGAYISLQNDLEGFLNVNDISWTRKIKNASDIIKKDQELELLVLDVSSKEKKISLGLKQTIKDPWENISDYFNIDDKLNGKVLYILDKGIIFLLDNDFEGILPISKINEDAKDLFEINKEFALIVSQINQESRKIVLNIDESNNESSMVEDKTVEDDKNSEQDLDKE